MTHFQPAAKVTFFNRDMQRFGNRISPPGHPPHLGETGGPRKPERKPVGGETFAFALALSTMFACLEANFNVMAQTLAVQAAVSGLTSAFVNQIDLRRHDKNTNLTPSFLKNWSHHSFKKQFIIASSMALVASGPFDVAHTLTHKLDRPQNSSISGVLAGCLVKLTDDMASPPPISKRHPSKPMCLGL